MGTRFALRVITYNVEYWNAGLARISRRAQRA